MRFPITRILAIVLGLLILAGLVYAFMPQPVVVDVGEVVRGPMFVTVDEDGRTRIRDRYVVSAPLNGQIQRITLRPGDRVEAGTTILTTIAPADPALLDARAIAEAEARVGAARTAMRRAEPAREQARAEVDFAENELARVETAFQRGAVTDREVEAARLRLRTATEGYHAAQLAEEIARYELEVAQAALIHTRPDGSDGVEHMPITAPVDGRVLQVFQESMAVVTPGTPLVEIGDPTDLEMVIDVLSTDAVRIAPGSRVLIEHWGGQRMLEGRVRLVEPRAFTHISALGVEEQRVNIVADFDDPPNVREALGDNYRVEARIVVWEDADVLKVPTAALFRVGQPPQWAAFAIDDGRARMRLIEIGRRTGLEAQVLDGLSAGDVVIIHPGDNVHDGRRISVRP